MRLRLAILDDYQSVALDYAPWEQLAADGVEVTVFTQPFRDDAHTVSSLRDFDVVIAMRERTAFGRDRLRQLPGLKLLVTTGMANQSIDLQAAEEQGITGVRNRRFAGSRPGTDLGPAACVRPQHSVRRPTPARRPLAVHRRL